MTRRTLAVVSAGTSQPSSTRLLADQLAAAAAHLLDADGTALDVAVIELRDLAPDITNHLLTGFPGPELRRALATVTAANGIIAVTPIYNASYSGLFKSFFDVLDPDAIVGTPTLIAATGGTERHSLALEHALRPLFTHLRASVVPTAVFAASTDWGGGRESHRSLAERVDRAASELARAVAAADAPGRSDPFATAPEFARLLRG